MAHRAGRKRAVLKGQNSCIMIMPVYREIPDMQAGQCEKNEDNMENSRKGGNV